MREFITGNQAVVRGALRAGCDYVAGYPITPASSILSDFVRAFAGELGIVVQTEDEIAAIGQCIGAAMAGARALTATSGPGLSLYSENIGLAQMGETPLVIVDCQRMGPATGGATATGDGDVIFARHVTAGGYPLPVLAATDAASAYRLTYEAFNIAERLRTPVIVLSSKDIALTRQTVDLDAISLPPRLARRAAADNGPYAPYAVDRPESSPAFAPIGGLRRVRFTGSIHDERGLLTIDRGKIERKLTHLRDKIAMNAGSLEDVDADLDGRARTLIVSYGVADGAARVAVRLLRRGGTRVSHVTLYSLWPMPVRALRDAVEPGVERIVVPELNIGLYADELRRVFPARPIESIQRYDGGLIAPRTIVDHVVRAESAKRTEAFQPC
ncbi:MAG: pyruvate flavodoxin/ferredoxin oxidoreductase [Phycisphaerae bacterium]|nr:pyruvate flavodoxin/ferredoxin oxidoreductase [Phycisphaerae bacterium]NUQ46875.1 pyruvate flavodoxin/ferredoxin oxidoreductase [Phycisphaerae bacterium]